MQISIFDLDCQKPYKIKKPIRLIELFGGIGSQAKALENLQANFTHYRLCEFYKYAVTSYNAVHGTNFKTSDITKITAADLGIVETNKYEYIMTYSFPCTDLSVAGKQAGMAKGSGTRSGLLWEVERLLDECEELPQVLLMENVTQVTGTKDFADFEKWLLKLEKLGYKNTYQNLNANDYGIPQNRNRTFMVSMLGDYYYEFPKAIPLKLRLKDMLEEKVEEKYYLRAEQLENIKPNEVNTDISKTVRASGHSSTERHSWDIVAEKCECIQVAQIDGSFESTGRIYGDDGLCPTIRTMQGGNLEPKIAEPTILQQPHGFNKGAELEYCPSITTSCWESNNLLKEPIIFDDFNQRVKADQTAINTLTTNCGSCSAERNGIKIIEPKTNERFFRQAIETANKNECENGDTINAFNKTVDKTGISPTITTRPEGFKTAILPIQNYRIRKLTPKECWRLMGFSDKDFYAAQSAGVSNSQLYKQAGNSIVVPVLEAIFRNLF